MNKKKIKSVRFGPNEIRHLLLIYTAWISCLKTLKRKNHRRTPRCGAGGCS